MAAGGVLLSLSYDGGPYAGFAPQLNARTISGELLGALRDIDPRIATLRGSSRTDAGVHARDQRVAFDPTLDLPLSAWSYGLQRHLPHDIVVRDAWSVPRGFQPRHHAIAKTYRYELLLDERRDPLLRGRVWRVAELAGPGALERMVEEARSALGTHDFAAFRKSRDVHTDTTRTLSGVTVRRSAEDPRRCFVDVRGDRFLYNMVRILVGTLVDVGRRRIEAGAIGRALASGNRRDAGITAPAEGLYLQQFELKMPPSELATDRTP